MVFFIFLTGFNTLAPLILRFFVIIIQPFRNRSWLNSTKLYFGKIHFPEILLSFFNEIIKWKYSQSKNGYYIIEYN